MVSLGIEPNLIDREFGGPGFDTSTKHNYIQCQYNIMTRPID